MNPGPVEEVGQTGRSAIDALKSTPGMLTLIILQMVTIAILAWVAHERNTYETNVNKVFSDLVTLVIKQCAPNQQGENVPIPLPTPFPENVPRG